MSGTALTSVCHCTFNTTELEANCLSRPGGPGWPGGPPLPYVKQIETTMNQKYYTYILTDNVTHWAEVLKNVGLCY